MIAGQLPADPTTLSPGSRSGRHLRQPDPGQPGQRRRRRHPLPDGRRTVAPMPMNVYNNMIVNNVSTHEGGGIAHRRRAERADLQQHDHEEPHDGHRRHLRRPAGSGRAVHRRNSDQLQATLPAGSPTFSNPLLFNNIFWDNRAGTRAGTTVTGIGVAGRRHPDQPLGPRRRRRHRPAVADELGDPAERRRPPVHRQRHQHGGRPGVVEPYDVSVVFATWRPEPGLRRGDPGRPSRLPPNLLGDYHLTSAGARPRPSTPAPRPRRCRATSSRRRAAPRHRHRRPAQAGSGRVRHRRRRGPAATATCPSRDGRRALRRAGGSLTYTIAVANAGPSAVSGAGHRHLPGRADRQQLDLHRLHRLELHRTGSGNARTGTVTLRAATARRSRRP